MVYRSVCDCWQQSVLHESKPLGWCIKILLRRPCRWWRAQVHVQRTRESPNCNRAFWGWCWVPKSNTIQTHYGHTLRRWCLKIPQLVIYDAFETYVRNLLAFEHYHISDAKRCAIQYILFLDELISTEKDVSLLVKTGIITNNIGGSDEYISKLFNDLCNDININCDFYYYSEISLALREYCKTQCHRWMASLRRDYFNTPWAFISFLAATILILLTIMQAIYSALSYYKWKPWICMSELLPLALFAVLSFQITLIISYFLPYECSFVYYVHWDRFFH